MPYTPPAQLSPAASKQPTPQPSRSPSYVQYHATPEFSFPQAEARPQEARPQLPRSAGSSSYLNKHRRSPSLPTGNEPPEAMTDEQRGISFDPYGSIRQSPPPSSNRLMPAGMTISPPESSHNSDDEEVRGRTRELMNGHWAELESAVRSMQGHRKSGSPTRSSDPPVNGDSTYKPILSLEQTTRPALHSPPRKVSHLRATTEPSVQSQESRPPQSPRSEDNDTSDSEVLSVRPMMVRKKSGELVKPALRPHSRRRPSSMPGTPTYSKAVHFDSQLEHVRHFLQVDRPLAVSANSSPVDTYESETEFPFGSDETSARSRGPSFEWEIKIANFPPATQDRTHQPVHVERVFLSADNKQLIGVIAVQNLAFHKQVTVRFTFDYWKTTSEVAAEFFNDARRVDPADGLDRFNFSISLADQVNLENKTLFFCTRYNVNGQEYWDSNNDMNYQIDFVRKLKGKTISAAPTGLGVRPLSALPRSRPSPPASAGRPKSMPVAFDDFASGGFDNLDALSDQSAVLIGEPKIKLRSPRSQSDLTSDTPLRRNKSAAPMFGHRYDFNSSLTAAKHSAYAVLGDQSGLPAVDTSAKQFVRDVPAMAAKIASAVSSKLPSGSAVVAAPIASAVGAPLLSSKPAALVSEKPPLTSQSYQELVDKYCFVGTPRTLHDAISTK